MEIYAAVIISVLIYVYLKNDKKKNKFKEAQDARKICSLMQMGEVLYRIAQIQSELKTMGFLTEKQKIIWEALELRRMELKETSTPESIAKDLEELAIMERYKNFE